jgi:hypothetical protein
MSHYTHILLGICKYYYARTSQNIVQKLPFPTTNKPNVHVIRRYHKHLHDGTKSDTVTGWLLYASFYYVLGQEEVRKGSSRNPKIENKRHKYI